MTVNAPTDHAPLCVSTRRRRDRAARAVPPSPIVMRSIRLPSSGEISRSSRPSSTNGASLPRVRSSPTCSTSPLSRSPPPRAVRARRRRGAGLVGDDAAQASRLFSGAHREAALRIEAADPGWLDASLCPARHAARRARGRRAGHRRLARAYCRQPGLPGLLLLPFVPEDGAIRRGSRGDPPPCADAPAAVQRHTRALLAPKGDAVAAMSSALGGAQVRELRRTARRLGEAGAMLFTTATEPARGRCGDGRFPRAGSQRLEGQSRHRGRLSTTDISRFRQTGSRWTCRESIRSRSTASCSTAARSRPRSRCAAAMPRGSGRSPMTKVWRALRRRPADRAGDRTARRRRRQSRCADFCATADHAVMNRTSGASDWRCATCCSRCVRRRRFRPPGDWKCCAPP